MTKNEILEKLKDMVCEQLRLERDAVQLETEIIKGLGADSLDLVELLMNVEAEWNIIVDDSEVGDLRLVSDVVDMIERKTK
ncbi:MAG: acyl carrier protein [Eubacteriales bacterium]|nr:acyl carrier protein [Bacillota bacterium]MDY4559114.1 acyl carrier protein [Eubacteriales bacterium]MDY5345543.1 acyl carrier protein [Eubacteriales bacterium]